MDVFYIFFIWFSCGGFHCRLVSHIALHIGFDILWCRLLSWSSTERPGVCWFSCHRELGQTTVVNRLVLQSPCVYQYCIQSVCVQQGRMCGFQGFMSDDLAVGYWMVNIVALIGALPWAIVCMIKCYGSICCYLGYHKILVIRGWCYISDFIRFSCGVFHHIIVPDKKQVICGWCWLRISLCG